MDYIGDSLKSELKILYRVLDDIDIPANSFERSRNQYNAELLLNEISKISFDNTEKKIGLIDEDIYSEGYKYIFGEAENPGINIIVSTRRLNPEYYGQKYNQDVFFERVLKEILHELGHTYGLSHCPDRNCTMYFSNTLADTDYKKASYCERCQKLLKIYCS